jgi:tetratricopeptide (TPR) repeat protein
MVLLALLTLLTPVTATASSVLESVSVPGIALGDCMYPGDLGAMAANPAGTFFVPRSGITGSYTLLTDFARHNVLGYVERWESCAVGLLLAQQYRDGIELRQSLGDTPTSGMASHTGILASFAGRLPYGFTAGGGIKAFQSSIAGSDSNWSFGLDAGVYREVVSWGSLLKSRLTMTAGAAATDLIATATEFSGARETVRASARVSFAGSLTLFPRYDLKRESLEYDLVTVFGDAGLDAGYGVGVEYRRWNCALRAGWRPGTYAGYVLGCGTWFGDLALDYAFTPFIGYGLHSLAVTYSFGSIHTTSGRAAQSTAVPDELEDFLAVKQRAERIYDRYYKEAGELSRAKKYQSAVGLLEKIIPIMPGRTEAADLLAVCRTGIVTEQLAAVNTRYTRQMTAGVYPDAFDAVLEAVDLAPEETLTRNMLAAMRAADKVPVAQRQIMQRSEARFVEKLGAAMDSAVAKADFDGASRELSKLAMLQPTSETTYKHKRRLESERREYADAYVRKAMQFAKDDKLPEAYACIREAYRVAKDDAILMQVRIIKARFRKPSLYEDLYQQKLYYNAAAAFSTDDRDMARSAYFELKAANPAYDCDLLEQALIRAGIVMPNLP